MTHFPSSLIEFFKKMKKWIEMATLTLDFQHKIEALERKFEVASIINDKYKKVFHDLFLMPDHKQQTPNKRARKASKLVQTLIVILLCLRHCNGECEENKRILNCSCEKY